jgi:hypothetical protein
MSSKGCDPDEAFTTLRTESQYESRKLREVAAEIVARQKRSTGRDRTEACAGKDGLGPPGALSVPSAGAEGTRT